VIISGASRVGSKTRHVSVNVHERRIRREETRQLLVSAVAQQLAGTRWQPFSGLGSFAGVPAST
jgi:hypothetical protein